MICQKLSCLSSDPDHRPQCPDSVICASRGRSIVRRICSIVNSFRSNRFLLSSLDNFMTANDERRIRELTKIMASENDPARLKLFSDELKTILEKYRSTKPTENSAT